nr:hypothetical protein [uncultured Carboxylicivirga sp.]
MYYSLSSKDLDKQNEISIDFYNTSGNQTDSYKFYFEIEPNLPGITVSYKEIAGRVGSSKSVDVFLYTQAGVQSLKIAKYIDEILDSSNDLDVPVDSLQLFDDHAYSYQINHDYTELEYNKKVVYKLTFTDNVNNTFDISTLGPEPKRQSIYLTNVMDPDSDTWGVDSKRFYSIKNDKEYCELELLENPDLQSEINIVMEGVIFVSPHISIYTEYWAIRNKTEIKYTGIYINEWLYEDTRIISDAYLLYSYFD